MSRSRMHGASRSWRLRCPCGMALRSPLTPRWSAHSEGMASPEAAVPDKLGLCLSKRRGENGRRLTRSCLRHGGCRLVVFGIEVGGRWNGEARDLLRALARAKARERPQCLRASALQAFHQRWSGVVAVAAQRAAPPLPEVLAAARHGAAEAVSRLPLRPG